VIRDERGVIEPSLLTNLEPQVLHSILKKLILILKDHLDEKRRSDESLLEELIKVRDSVT